MKFSEKLIRKNAELAAHEKREIVADAEQRFIAGENHFEPRKLGGLAWMVVNEPNKLVFRAHEDIVKMLKTHNAQGAIYTIESGPGNDASMMIDKRVLVFAREGQPTGETPVPIELALGNHYAITNSTGDFEFPQQ